MDTTSIERMAKNAVDEYFILNGFVRPYISENDKTPIWDGNIFIYQHKEKLNNNTLLFKIPVQLKGEYLHKVDFPQHTYYRLSKKSINQYLCDGGVLFIKVLLNETHKEIYYNFLTKYKLNKLLSSAKGKSCSFQLEPIKDIHTFLEKANAFHLQKTKTLITPIELKDKSFSITCHAMRFEGENEFAFIARTQKQLTVSVDGFDEEFYLECEDRKLCSKIEEQKSISINGTEFYKEIVRVYNEDRSCSIYIGESLRLKLTPETAGIKIDFSITLKANCFEELLHELRFLNSLIDNKKLTIGTVTIDLPTINEKDAICVQWRKMLKLWEDTEVLFNTLHIYESLDIDILTDEDYKRLDKLIKAILYNKTLVTSEKSDHLELIKIGNLNIILLVKLLDGKNCQLLSIQNESVTVSATRNGVLYPLPIFSKIFREDILQSNIDFSNIINEYESYVGRNPYLYEVINEDILCLLKHYDKNKNPILLENVIKMSEWLLNKGLNKENEDIYKLNLLQAKQRYGDNFSEEEMDYLYSITETSVSYIHKWGAAILLKEYKRAEIYWSKIDSNDKEDYKQYPIYNLVPESELYRYQ